MKFRLSADLLTNVSPAREQEWKLALIDLNADADGEEPTLTLSRPSGGGAQFAITGTSDGRDGVVELSREELRPAFRDYRRIIEQISGAGAFGARQFETLDYAKKLVHDEAGELVQEALKPRVTIDHRTGRRLFTLVFLVSEELPEVLVRQHRRHQ